MKVQLTVTAKGALLPQNKWVEGQTIEVHFLTAAIFIAKGFCRKLGEEIKDEIVDIAVEKLEEITKKTKKLKIK